MKSMLQKPYNEKNIPPLQMRRLMTYPLFGTDLIELAGKLATFGYPSILDQFLSLLPTYTNKKLFSRIVKNGQTHEHFNLKAPERQQSR